MERFEMTNDSGLEVFSNFVSKTKNTFSNLNSNIKENIKKYEQAIEETEKSIAENDSSREKCEHEISKMENKIDSIKENIENVENTYRKMVDAYSQTSKGETKDLYSEIIDGAKANCEKEVEKNRSEIARLNSDIEAIKNNIAEFSRAIDGFNKDLDNYKDQLNKYTKAQGYIDKELDSVASGLGNIDDVKLSSITRTTKSSAKKVEFEEKVKEEPKKVKKEEPEIVENTESLNELSIDDELQRIYDLTGYKPKHIEEPQIEATQLIDTPIDPEPEIVGEVKPVVEEEKIQVVDDDVIVETPKEEPKLEIVDNSNLENLFQSSTPDMKPESTSNFNDNEMSEWEKILNGMSTGTPQNINSEPEVKEPDITPLMEINNPEPKVDTDYDTANQLLKPYGTDYDRLKKLASNRIVYKDGKTVDVEISASDIILAVNQVDGNDLRAMKVVGPEITLLRKIKSMKEGNK